MRNLSIVFLAIGALAFASCKGGDNSKSNNNNNIVESRPSPLKESTGTVGDCKIVIKYGSPAVKGRTIFGSLVPYDEVWRMGANEATNITTTADLNVGGQLLKAGKYAIFSIPTENKWTVIFNSTWDQWGSYDYEASKDVLRVEITPITTEMVQETLDFSIENNKIIFQWDHTKLEIPLSPAA